MLKKLLFAISLLVAQVTMYGQLADGSTAPDFTLTDYYGTEHNLYEYLDAGKTVFVEIFAAHCPSCWNYHQTHTLKDLYNAYGPDGTDELMVLALEYDQWNGHGAFSGTSDPWNTAGNWLEGTPYPLFNVEDPDRGVFDDYNVTGYPVVYKICSNRISERVSTFETDEALYEKVVDCQAVLSVNDHLDLGTVSFNPLLRTLNISHFQNVKTVRIMSVTGQVVETIRAFDSSSITIGPMTPGIYLFEINTENGASVRKFFLD